MPFYGSAAAKVAVRGRALPCGREDAVGTAARVLGLCQLSPETLRSLLPVPDRSRARRDAAFRKSALDKVGGVLCGTSGFGVPSRHSIAFAAKAAYLYPGEPSDGLVSLPASCAAFGALLAPSRSTSVAELAINHFDGTMRNGDSSLFGGPRPSEWFRRARPARAGGEATAATAGA